MSKSIKYVYQSICFWVMGYAILGVMFVLNAIIEHDIHSVRVDITMENLWATFRHSWLVPCSVIIGLVYVVIIAFKLMNEIDQLR